MRTVPTWFIIVALGVSASMWGLAGVDDVLAGPGVADDLNSDDELESQSPDDIGINGSADSSSGEGDIVGLILSGARSMAGIVGMVVLLPAELHKLGFPRWFAYPIGLMAQLVASIGLVQFAVNRYLR